MRGLRLPIFRRLLLVLLGLTESSPVALAQNLVSRRFEVIEVAGMRIAATGGANEGGRLTGRETARIGVDAIRPDLAESRMRPREARWEARETGRAHARSN